MARQSHVRTDRIGRRGRGRGGRLGGRRRRRSRVRVDQTGRREFAGSRRSGLERGRVCAGRQRADGETGARVSEWASSRASSRATRSSSTRRVPGAAAGTGRVASCCQGEMPDAASARCASERDSSSDASFDFSPRSRSQCAFLPPCRNNVYRSAPPGGAPSTAPAQRAGTSRRGGGGGACGSQTSQRRAAVPRLFAASGRQTTSAASLGQGEAGAGGGGKRVAGVSTARGEWPDKGKGGRRKREWLARKC